MDLSIAPLSRTNLERALSIMGNRPAFSAAEYLQFTRAVGSLLDSCRAIGRVVVEGTARRPRAISVATFVDEAAVERFLRSPHASFGKELVLSAPEAILNLHAIGLRNHGGGLQSVVIAQGCDDSGAAGDRLEWLFGTAITAFIDACRGYRIERVVSIGHGDENAFSAVAKVGAPQFAARFVERHPGGVVRTAVFTLTRAEAFAARHVLLPVFLYQPPVVRFTRTEQEIIRSAVHGRTDAEIARALKLTPSAVKARWTRIQARFFTRHEDDSRRLPINATTRGAQIRHRILKYARENPSELTPYVEGVVVALHR